MTAMATPAGAGRTSGNPPLHPPTLALWVMAPRMALAGGRLEKGDKYKEDFAEVKKWVEERYTRTCGTTGNTSRVMPMDIGYAGTAEQTTTDYENENADKEQNEQLAA